MTNLPETPLLDTVKTPADLRQLKPTQLRQLADEHAVQGASPSMLYCQHGSHVLVWCRQLNGPPSAHVDPMPFDPVLQHGAPQH